MQDNTADQATLHCLCAAEQPRPLEAVGSYSLPHSHALTLTAKTPGELQIAHGRVWVTYTNAAQDASARAGDHFLQAGEVLHLACGQQVVMESVDMSRDAVAYFNWVSDASASLVVSCRRVQPAHSPIRQPLVDLGTALHQAGWALGRLVQGLGRSLACTLMLRHGTP